MSIPLLGYEHIQSSTKVMVLVLMHIYGCLNSCRLAPCGVAVRGLICSNKGLQDHSLAHLMSLCLALQSRNTILFRLFLGLAQNRSITRSSIMEGRRIAAADRHMYTYYAGFA